MRLIGREVLARGLRKHPEVRQWLAAWTITVEDVDWSNLNDVRHDYPSADGVRLRSGVTVTVFNVKGNKFRLLANINYSAAFVQVLRLLTHAEYNKEQWKRWY
jgi:mRNA interferase HigB